MVERRGRAEPILVFALFLKILTCVPGACSTWSRKPRSIKQFGRSEDFVIFRSSMRALLIYFFIKKLALLLPPFTSNFSSTRGGGDIMKHHPYLSLFYKKRKRPSTQQDSVIHVYFQAFLSSLLFFLSL